MSQQVLITGGGGVIGRYLAAALLRRGLTVRVLDNLRGQVHGCAAGTRDIPDARPRPMMELEASCCQS